MTVYRISDAYEVRPHGNGLCWELWEYRTVNAGKDGEREEWAFTGKYPTTLSHALGLVLEMQLKKGDEPIRGLKAAVERMRAIADSLATRGTEEFCRCVNPNDDGVGGCDKCGSLMETGDNFCPNCGRPQGRSTE